jgi:hypothetical protein
MDVISGRVTVNSGASERLAVTPPLMTSAVLLLSHKAHSYRGELRCFGRVSSYSSTYDIRRVTVKPEDSLISGSAQVLRKG